MSKARSASLSAVVAVAALAVWAPGAEAFPLYSQNQNEVGNCADCHKGFRDTSPYFSHKDNANWSNSLHNIHVGSIIPNANCGWCHFGSGTTNRQVNLRSSQLAADGQNAIACSGCHGRLEDANIVTSIGTGWGAGLRQRHFNANRDIDIGGGTIRNTQICAACHADANPAVFTPVGENVLPPFYDATAIDPTPLDPCNTAGRGEHFDGSTVGLDNDGDLLFDTFDADCPCATNADCDNGFFCDGAEVCNTTTGDCEAGAATDCDDSVGCTDDSCNEATDSCDHVSNNANCDDGFFCTGVETCDAANDCQPGTPVDCGDGVGCTDDSCDEVNDACENDANDANCPDDGQFCNGTEFCDAVSDCSSIGDPCLATEVCDEIGNVCELPATCGDGNLDAGEDCDDGNTTPGDCCAPNCTLEADGSPCGDPADTTCDAPDTCLAGSCQDNFEAAGTPCDDQLFCNVDEICDGAGGCGGGGPNGCDDGLGCTDDSCDEVGDACVNDANDANCPDDGLFCNGTEFCDAIADCSSNGDPCLATEVCDEIGNICELPATCGDGNLDAGEDCDDGNTNPGDCCAPNCTLEAAGTPCDDQLFCNVNETCDGAGGCGGGEPNGCDDGVGCTDDSCNEVADDCVNDANGVNCPDDGLFCNGTEFCDPIADCSSNGDPCAAGEVCDEDGDVCALASSCAASPQTTCLVATQAKLQYSEKVAGKEKAKLQWKKIADPTTQAGFGDPVTGDTTATACIYDDAGNLVQDLIVERAGQFCDGKPCWKAAGTKGWLYKDKTASTDGIAKLLFKGGDATKGRAGVSGKNNPAKGQIALPTGVVAGLAGNTAPTIQMLTTGGFCVGATITEVKKDDGLQYKAQKK